MIKKTIEYKDHNGETRKEDFYFNLSKAEVMEMELSIQDGMSTYIQGIIDSKSIPELAAWFKKMILTSYGIKSADGRSFVKLDDEGRPLSIKFSQTEAFSELYMELTLNTESATNFVEGIMPDMSNINVVGNSDQLIPTTLSL